MCLEAAGREHTKEVGGGSEGGGGLGRRCGTSRNGAMTRRACDVRKSFARKVVRFDLSSTFASPCPPPAPSLAPRLAVLGHMRPESLVLCLGSARGHRCSRAPALRQAQRVSCHLSHLRPGHVCITRTSHLRLIVHHSTFSHLIFPLTIAADNT